MPNFKLKSGQGYIPFRATYNQKLPQKLFWADFRNFDFTKAENGQKRLETRVYFPSLASNVLWCCIFIPCKIFGLIPVGLIREKVSLVRKKVVLFEVDMSDASVVGHFAFEKVQPVGRMSFFMSLGLSVWKWKILNMTGRKFNKTRTH